MYHSNSLKCFKFTLFYNVIVERTVCRTKMEKVYSLITTLLLSILIPPCSNRALSLTLWWRILARNYTDYVYEQVHELLSNWACVGGNNYFRVTAIFYVGGLFYISLCSVCASLPMEENVSRLLFACKWYFQLCWRRWFCLNPERRHICVNRIASLGFCSGFLQFFVRMRAQKCFLW